MFIFHSFVHSCSIGYFGYPYCRECECNVNGTRDQVCEVGGGQCPCKTNYEGSNCDRCAYGYYGFPDCQCKSLKECGCTNHTLQNVTFSDLYVRDIVDTTGYMLDIYY